MRWREDSVANYCLQAGPQRSELYGGPTSLTLAASLWADTDTDSRTFPLLQKYFLA